MKKSFLIASGNKHKIDEIKKILASSGLEILSGLDFDLPEVNEDQDSLEGNSLKKAREVALLTGKNSLADDTGLFVEALDGRPGIYAARYAGEGCSFTDNRSKLLLEMKGAKDRAAFFATVVTFCNSNGEKIFACKGVMRGEIATAEIGDKGFGYDNIFVPEGYDKTLGELSPKVKNKISHRGKALQEILPKIEKYFNDEGE